MSVSHAIQPTRLPRWLVGTPAPIGAGRAVKAGLRAAGAVSVCEQAHCPNLVECFEQGVATFMLLGDTCTRACTFCAVRTGPPAPPQADEPRRIAGQAQLMGLSHVVLTSVDRDDLADGGASQFAATLAALSDTLPHATCEVLTPDFNGDINAIDTVLNARPTVYNHNLETVPRLTPEVRDGGDYRRSLALIERVASGAVVAKSGMMVGLGETDAELLESFADLARAGCRVLTLGQYLRPSRQHRPVHRYLTPAALADLGRAARAAGIPFVAAAPQVRSSYNAAEVLRALGRPDVNLNPANGEQHDR